MRHRFAVPAGLLGMALCCVAAAQPPPAPCRDVSVRAALAQVGPGLAVIGVVVAIAWTVNQAVPAVSALTAAVLIGWRCCSRTRRASAR